MANNLKKSIFFAGGKIIVPESNDNNVGLKFIRLEKGEWRITLDLKISEKEAAGIINRFEDFTIESEDDFEKTFSNQVYFEAFNDKSDSIDIKVTDVTLHVLNARKNESGGSIVFSMTPPTGVGKTQNDDTKTQNGNT